MDFTLFLYFQHRTTLTTQNPKALKHRFAAQAIVLSTIDKFKTTTNTNMDKTPARQPILLSRSQIQINNDLLNIIICIGSIMSKDNMDDLNEQLHNSSLEGNFLCSLLKRVFLISRFRIQTTNFHIFLARACARDKPSFVSLSSYNMIYYKEIRYPSLIPHFPDEVKEEEEMVDIAGGRSTPTGPEAIRAATPNPPINPTPETPTEPNTVEMAIEPPINPSSDLLHPSLQRPSSPASVASGSGVVPRVGPKAKGSKAPLSVEAKREKRRKERSNRKEKRDAEINARRGNTPNTNRLGENAGNSFDDPQDQPPPPPPRPTLRTPGEVYGEVNPRFTLSVSRPGAGTLARQAIINDLLFVPGNYTIGPLRSQPDGVAFEAGEDGSAVTVREALESAGWTVVQTPIWNRFSFVVPADYHHLSLDMIVRYFLFRNGTIERGAEGIPDNAIRGANMADEGEEGGALPRRVRAWIDVSPEGEEYLNNNDMLLRTLTSAVRLRPAANSRPANDRS